MTGWRRVRIGEIARQRKGSITISDDTEYKLCRVQLHRKGVVLREKLPGAAIKTKKQQVCKAGDLIVAEMDAKFGGYGFIGEELDGAIVSSHYYLYELDPAKIGKEYFLVLIHSGTIQSQIEAKGSTNYSSIRGWEFLDYEIPLPSLDIQAQIAARFNTCFSAVNNHDLQASEQLLLLKQLRQAVLQEAVEGKLTADWRTKNLPRLQGGNYDFLPPLQGEGRGGDGLKGDPRYDAAALLAQIKAEKERLVKAGKIRKEKPLPPIAESERPFELPAGWVWCRLGEVAQSISTGPFGSMLHKSDYVSNGIPLVNPMNMVSNRIIPSGKMMVSKETSKRLERYCLQSGDIVVARRGDLSKCAIVEADNVGWLCGTGSFFLKLCQVDNYFFIKIFVSKYSQSYLLRDSIGQTMDNLNQGLLAKMPFPLPPLAEQQAIVARVDSLMAMIDELEQQIDERKVQAQMLMQAVLREAFAGGEGAESVDACVGATHASPVSATPHRTRARHASPLREPADKTKRAGLEPAPTETLPLVAEPSATYKTRGQAALPAANQPVPCGIPARILAAMQPGRDYSRADLLAVTGINETDWIWAIRQLKEQGRVVQKGEKRGARYVPK